MLIRKETKKGEKDDIRGLKIEFKKQTQEIKSEFKKQTKTILRCLDVMHEDFISKLQKI